MFEIVLNSILWCFAVYGFLILMQDIYRNNTYKKIEKNIKLIMTVNNVEEGIENYIREMSCGRNYFNNLVVIDLNSKDDTLNILHELEKENFNMKILTKNEGKEYLEKMIK